MVVASSQCSHPCLEGAVRDSRSGEWSEREELGLGRSLNPHAVAHE
jgi:hypothetical protein